MHQKSKVSTEVVIQVQLSRQNKRLEEKRQSPSQRGKLLVHTTGLTEGWAMTLRVNLLMQVGLELSPERRVQLGRDKGGPQDKEARGQSYRGRRSTKHSLQPPTLPLIRPTGSRKLWGWQTVGV